MAEGKKRSNQIALLLSGILPGLGQFYNRDWGKGVAFLVGFLILDSLLRKESWIDVLKGNVPLTADLFIRLGILAVYIVFSIVDADRSAKNKNKAPESSPS